MGKRQEMWKMFSLSSSEGTQLKTKELLVFPVRLTSLQSLQNRSTGKWQTGYMVRLECKIIDNGF